MKIRFYPKTEAVKAFLKNTESQLDEAYNDFLAKAAKKAESSLYDPTGESERINEAIKLTQKQLDFIKAKYALLESHALPEVMMELQIGE